RQCDVLICTAQILENSLCNLDNEVLDIGVFTLLIIDECHHIQKEAVYNKIMYRYLEDKLKRQKKNLPQILRLTASPGVVGAKKQKQAVTHIFKICANLDANSIKTVQDHKHELQKTEGAQEEHGGHRRYLMNNIHAHIQERSNSEFGSQGYEQWIVEQENAGAMDTNRDLRACALHLRKYNDALLISTIRMVDAFNHLQNFYVEEGKKEDNKDNLLRDTISIYVLHLEAAAHLVFKSKENPNLETLQEAVPQGFRSRGIIFTKTRQSAQTLWQYLKAAGMRAHFLIGADHSNQLKHMTQVSGSPCMLLVYQKFRTGQLNQLVSTTVAEKGLDIKECNFVIRYSLVTNETAMARARGRARAEDITYSLVAMEGTGVVERENTNIYRETMMHKAIETVQSMKRDDYLKKVNVESRETIHERGTKERQKKIKSKTVQARDVIFHCQHCRIINDMHHVNVQENFK
uniref:RNA helicase n=1 Tax=Petromyzon marinus TaxID=7757 RepID=S4RSA6_PETMA